MRLGQRHFPTGSGDRIARFGPRARPLTSVELPIDEVFWRVPRYGELRGNEGIAMMARTFTATPTQIFRRREGIG